MGQAVAKAPNHRERGRMEHDLVGKGRMEPDPGRPAEQRRLCTGENDPPGSPSRGARQFGEEAAEAPDDERQRDRGSEQVTGGLAVAC